MEKEEGQVLDDSALINAFDQAISKYKKMHGIDDSVALDASQEDYSHPEAVEDGYDNGSHVTVEAEEVENLDTAKENEITESLVPEEHALEPNTVSYQDLSQNYSSSLEIDEYNKLYKQYCEVEEQRQNILQKLQHISNGHYSYPTDTSVSGLQWGTNYATQEYQPVSQVPCGTPVVSCVQCACPCSTTSCPPSGAVCASTAHIGVGRKPAAEDDIVKTAIGAAKQALSTLNDKTSDSTEENNAVTANGSSETDLSTVLNAWYSAGFYTGKYLTEKSREKQHD